MCTLVGNLLSCLVADTIGQIHARPQRPTRSVSSIEEFPGEQDYIVQYERTTQEREDDAILADVQSDWLQL